ncbi:MAG: cytochrome c maturation protein CcmE [Acidimicrobiia bacterium]|nr:cytochrome c maturation protein CcmE [Acidimicrobiia bacterium]
MIRRYWKFLLPASVLLGILVILMINLSSNLVYFHTPTELYTEVAPSSDRLRLGGQVVAGTVEESGEMLVLTVTDGREALPVEHTGVIPQLFAEGQGVIVEGTWDGETFRSDTMLIRHDEQYRTEDNQIYDSVDHQLEES